MGLLDIFQTKKRDKRNNHTFTDADRQLSNMRRDSNKMFKAQMDAMKQRQMLLEQEYQMRLRQKQIDDFDFDDEDDYDDEDYEDEEDNSPEGKLIKVIEKAFTKPTLPNVNKDASAEELVKQIPSGMREKLKSMSPLEIKNMASMYYPDLPPPTIDAIISLL